MHQYIRKISRAVRASLAVVALISAIPAVSRSECINGPQSFYFDLPGGEPAAAFMAMHQQGHIDIWYDSINSIHGVNVNRVQGKLSLCQALDRLLSQTGLTYEFTGPRSVKVQGHKSDTKPLATDLYAPAPGPAVAVPVAARTAVMPRIEEVVVTGTFIRGAQESSSPLVVIDEAELKRSPYSSIADALHTLTLSSRAGPSEQFDPTTGGNFNRGESIDLRGLGEGATLVLVNGARQPASGYFGGFVDLSGILWSAVKRIEILPEGASAMYGSDAVAGVVNIILRDHLEGAETRLKVSSAPGGARETLLAQLVGTHWEGGKLIAAYQFRKRTPLDSSARDYAASDDKRPFGGTDLRSTLSNPGNILDLNTDLPIAAIPRNQTNSTLSTSQLLYGSSNLQNRMTDVQLLPNRVAQSLYLSASQQLSESTSVFAETRFTQQDVSQVFPATDEVLFVPGSNPFLHGDIQPHGFELVGYSFLNDLGPVAGSGRTRNVTFTAGLKRSLSDTWQVTAASTFGREVSGWADTGEVNQAALQSSLADPNPATAFNPYGTASGTSPSTLKAIAATQRVNARSFVWDTNLLADGVVLSLPAGDAKLALGGAFRREGLTHLKPSSVAFGRNVSSLFSQLEVPLIGSVSKSQSIPQLSVQVSARGEHYSDIGTTTNPRVEFQWAPAAQAKLRTSWGTSFRAPKLVDLYDSSDNAVGLVSVPDSTNPIGRTLVLVQQGSNPKLRDERASTWTVGLDVIPEGIPGFNSSFTFYQINYKNQIFHPGPSVSLQALITDPKWSPLITRNPSAGEVAVLCNSSAFQGSSGQCLTTDPSSIVILDARLLNLSRTRMSGVDAKMGELLPTKFGEFQIRLDGTYLFSYDQSVTGASPNVSQLNTVGNPISIQLRGEVKWNSVPSGNFGLGASMDINYSGTYRDTSRVPNVAVSSSTTADIEIHYRTRRGTGVLDNCEARFNVANIFNRDPPFADLEIGYDPRNNQPFGRVLGFYVEKDF